jgi:hypothetical protein
LPLRWSLLSPWTLSNFLPNSIMIMVWEP